MSQVTARVPDELVDALDAAAAQLKRSRAEIIRQALERYLEDFQDVASAMERLLDPTDPVLDWDEVRDGDSPPLTPGLTPRSLHYLRTETDI